MRMIERQRILGGCCTRCMLYWVYALLGVCYTRCMLYSVYAVLGVCCTRCMLYSVYAVLGVFCTLCMLYSVYVGLDVCCTQCQLMMMAWRDRQGWLSFVLSNNGTVVDEKERDGGWRWEQCGGYKQIREIMGTTFLIGLGRFCIGVITRWIGTGIYHTGDRMVTGTCNSLSPSFSWCVAPSLSFSSLTLSSPRNMKLSYPSLFLDAMIKS